MTEKPLPVLMPSEVSSRVGFFDRFAGLAARLASRAPFFAFCATDPDAADGKDEHGRQAEAGADAGDRRRDPCS
jgi:hypothetical protein